MSDTKSVKVWLSRWYHAERYRYSIPATILKFFIEAGLWTALLGTLITIGVALPVEFTGGIQLFSGEHITICLTAGGLWTKAEWCELTLGADDV